MYSIPTLITAIAPSLTISRLSTVNVNCQPAVPATLPTHLLCSQACNSRASVSDQPLLTVLAWIHVPSTRRLPPAPCFTELKSMGFENKSTVPARRHPTCRRLELTQAAAIFTLAFLAFRLVYPLMNEHVTLFYDLHVNKHSSSANHILEQLRLVLSWLWLQ